jgi:hypothetical protein
MPYRKFINAIKVVSKRVEAEKKEMLIVSAFTGWQMGAGGKKNFNQYLKGLGLLEKEKLDKSQIKAEAIKGYKIGNKIRMAYKKARKKNSKSKGKV